MAVSLSVIAPVIIMIAIGFIVMRRQWVPHNFDDVLSRYVMLIAAPALLFRNTVLVEFPEQLPWALWLSYYGAMVICFIVGSIICRMTDPAYTSAGRHIVGFGSSFSNTVMLGIPIIMQAFGPSAAVPLFTILAFHGLFSIISLTFLLETATMGVIEKSRVIRSVIVALMHQSVVLALLAGVLWGRTGIGLSDTVNRMLEIMGNSTFSVALVMTGASLAKVRIERSVMVGLRVSMVKLILHPALVFAFTHFIFDLPMLWVAVATVLAAMPSGIFTSVFAQRYQIATDAASSIILVTTLASAVTLIFILDYFSDYFAK